jgi:hypothetical protein
MATRSKMTFLFASHVSNACLSILQAQEAFLGTQLLMDNTCAPTIQKRTDLHLFHHGDSLCSYQSAEQGDYKRLI